ncbi:MAG: YgjP-like metallopeptidase domain-containing protein, partial [Chloroflexota bacterium]
FQFALRHRLPLKVERALPVLELNAVRGSLFQISKTDCLHFASHLRGQDRAELKARIPSLLETWLPVIGVELSAWGVKRMKTRWGTCNTAQKRLWLNLELAKKPPQCLEYVLVHELVHLLERHHNDHFRELMDGFLPLWRQYREDLNRYPLAHEEWGY